MKKNIYFYTNILAWALVLFLIGNYAFGWVTPITDPPEGDLSAPLDTSSTAQTKTGDLTIDSLFKVGRYSSAPTGSTGALYYDTTANEFKGYKASSWSSLGDSLWTQIGDDIYYNTGNVGIGTTTPSAKLDVEVSLGGAATIGSSKNSAIGNYAIAMGYNTNASGWGSTAMGESTTASEGDSTAMGYDTNASGNTSTAMGSWTTASGYISTAMGRSSTASGDYSTAMGDGTTASGQSSTAMGQDTTASGYCSTAMGDSTTASGYFSTAIGVVTNASGYGSTAMGRRINVEGDYSVGIGLAYDTIPSPIPTITQNNTMAIMGGNVGIGTTTPSSTLHVQDGVVLFSGTTGSTPVSGTGTRLMWIPAKSAFRAGYALDDYWDDANIGWGSFATGASTIASGTMSIAMGEATTASGRSSTAMGEGTTASGLDSTAMGEGSTASGDYSTAMGETTTASGQDSTAMGEYTIASGYTSTAMGSYTTASDWASTAMGYDTNASGYGSTAMGMKITAQGSYSFGIGLDNLTASTITQEKTMAIMGGNVGIGTTDPGEKLEVLGDILASGTITNDSDVKVPGVCIWAEESSNIAVGLVFSFGNGNILAYGITQPVSGTIVAMSLQQETGTANDGVVQIAINGAAQGASYQVNTSNAAQGGTYSAFGTPLAFSAGDRLSFSCTTAPSTAVSGVTVSMWIVYD